MRTRDTGLHLVTWFLLATFVMSGAIAAADQVLFDFETSFKLSDVQARDVRIKLVKQDDSTALQMASGHREDWPGITLKAPDGKWDLSAFENIELDVTNTGENAVTVSCRVDNPGADGVTNCITERIDLEPGQSGTMRAPLPRMPGKWEGIKLFGMRGFPAGFSRSIDPGNVTQLLVFVPKPKEDHLFQIANIRATGQQQPVPGEDQDKPFFPLIDTFGQYMHKDWPGKTHSVDDLKACVIQEAADLEAHPGPEQWNQYGGWENGPQLEATGHFRAEKYEGKWWMVDPEGKLFWSHGIDCVRSSTGTTPISDREDWFADLPEEGTPLAKFYGGGSWAPHGYYQGKTYKTYNFTAANLLRKYGDGWWDESNGLAHQRLRSWGMNTIANWSDGAIYSMRKTPYVVSLGVNAKKLEGSQGYWGKFHDVFDPGFRADMEKRVQGEKDKSASDPWCIGYFVDNELGWGDDLSLAIATMTSPADQPAKKVFVDDLRGKYGTIEKLNEAWDTEHESWDALMESRTPPDRRAAGEDLAAFYTKTAETYFRICLEAIRKHAPGTLYLGCRFAWVNDRAARAAAKYCDIVGYNRYARGVEDFTLPEGLDKPVVIGEFHFGALDRGMFHTGLQKTDSQEERAAAYESYVRGALRNPLIVGTHWFQYGDQATTGRGDGENYQIGFLDVCDTPYTETIEASRRVGYEMYDYRLNAGK